MEVKSLDLYNHQVAFESMCEKLLSHVLNIEYKVCRGGDFISSNPKVVRLFEEKGFFKTTSRFLMMKEIK